MPRLNQQQRRAQTSERLIAAAAELFAERGYHAVSLDQIAAAAGYSRGAVHYNFADKHDLFLGLLDDQLATRSNQLESAEPPSGDPSAVAAETVAALPFDRRFSLLFLEFACEAARDPEIATALRERLGPQRERNAAVAAPLLEAAGVGEAPVVELTEALSALANGLSVDALTGVDVDRLDARFSLIVGLVLEGLRSRGRADGGA